MKWLSFLLLSFILLPSALASGWGKAECGVNEYYGTKFCDTAHLIQDNSVINHLSIGQFSVGTKDNKPYLSIFLIGGDEDGKEHVIRVDSNPPEKFNKFCIEGAQADRLIKQMLSGQNVIFAVGIIQDRWPKNHYTFRYEVPLEGFKEAYKPIAKCCGLTWSQYKVGNVKKG